MAAAIKMYVKELRSIAKKGGFIDLLEAARQTVHLSQEACAIEIGLGGRASYNSAVQKCSFATFSKPNLDKLIELFDKLPDAKKVRPFFETLRQLRLKPLQEATNLIELATEIREYCGFTIKELSRTFNLSDDTLSANFARGSLFTNGKNSELKSFFLKTHPELSPFITALESKNAFESLKATQQEAAVIAAEQKHRSRRSELV